MTRIIIKPPTAVFLLLLGLTDRSALTLLPLAATFIHEAGHLLTMLIVGCRVQELEITLFGAEIRTPHESRGTFAAAAIYASGGLANLLSAAVVMLLPATDFAANFFAASSLALAAINLLPIRSLDGGCILEAVAVHFAPSYAPIILDVISGITLLALWLVSAYLLLIFGGNLSLMLFCVYLFVTLYLN